MTREAFMQGKWKTNDCAIALPYVCEKAADRKDITASTTPIPTASWDPRCGFLWTLDPLTMQCYMFSEEFTTWADARTTCIAHQGNLASFNNPHEQAFVTARLQNVERINYWIGMADQSGNSVWEWSDLSPVAYVNWDSAYPSNKEDTYCGTYVVPRAAWQTKKCPNRYSYICKKEALEPTPTVQPTTPAKTTPTTTPEGTIKACPTFIPINGQKWQQFKDKCYMFVEDVTLIFAAGRQRCKSWGGDLVSITNYLEQDFIEAEAKEKFKKTKNRTEELVWIGLNSKEHPNYYRWSDGSGVTFSKWGPNEPNNWENREDNCVMFNVTTGRWQDQSCDDTGRGYVCKRDLVVIPKPVTKPIIKGCPKETTFDYDGSCYVGMSDPRDWNAAEDSCTKKYGGHLLDIADRFEQSYLTARLTQYFGNYWIGYTNLGSTTGKWRWSSELWAAYTNWGRDFTGNERNKCAVIKTGEQLGLWQARSCSESNPYVCKMLKYGSTRPTTTIPPKPPKCPARWLTRGNWCYQVNKNYQASKRKTWTAALAHCRAQGADLASFSNKNDATYVGGRLTSSYGGAWIGLNTREGDKKYRWSDKSAANYFYWKNGQPNNHEGQENCVEMESRYRYYWVHSQCNLARNWVCKLKKGAPYKPPTNPPPTPKPDKHCGTDRDWYYYSGHCYYISKRSSYTWFAARDQCMKNGGDLASIHDNTTNAWLTTLTSLLSIKDFWIGLNYLDRDQYRWSDNTKTDYYAWNRGEPDDKNYGQLCVNMDSSRGFWKDDNCIDKFSYICRKFNATLTPKTHPVTTPVKGYCPAGFYSTGSNKCLKAFGYSLKERVTFKDAVNKCRSLGRDYDAASISNTREQVLVNALVGDGDAGFWIGLYKTSTSRVYWVDNSDMGYKNWDQREPGYLRNRAAEVQVGRKLGKWAMKPLNDKKGYICEYFKRSSERITTPATLPPSKCKPGYFPYKEHCYKVLTVIQEWEKAENACVADGGHLSSVQDLSEQSVISILINDINAPVWFGLISPEGTGDYGWVDEWPIKYTNWAPGNPRNPFNQPCGTLIPPDWRWNTTECDVTKKYAAICRTTTAKPPPTPPYVPGRCPDKNWQAYSRHCFKAIVSSSQNYATSSHSCFSESSSLASIHSRDENIAIFNAILELDNRYNRHIWIGLTRRNKDQPWVWYDGTEVEYTNWASANDPKPVARKNCVYMDFKSGLWRSSYCTSYYGRLCKTLKVPYTRPPGPTSTLAPTANPFPTARTAGSSSTPPSTQMPSFRTPKSTVIPSRRTGSNYFTTVKAPPGGLTAEGKVGVAFGVIIAILVGVLVVLVILRRKNRLPYQSYPSPDTRASPGFTNILYTPNNEYNSGEFPTGKSLSGLPDTNTQKSESYT